MIQDSASSAALCALVAARERATEGESNRRGCDGRLVAYYHPGDIGDAWADGHSGVPREVWESCYQLGVNIIFYAHAEYNKWLEATKERE